MKGTILTAIALAVFTLSAAQAEDLSPTPARAPGSPGTATPTPYPQITPRTPSPTVGPNSSAVPLPPIVLPEPPKDQTLPGLEQNAPKVKSPGG